MHKICAYVKLGTPQGAISTYNDFFCLKESRSTVTSFKREKQSTSYKIVITNCKENAKLKKSEPH
jgi:hypothetical protein